MLPDAIKFTALMFVAPLILPFGPFVTNPPTLNMLPPTHRLPTMPTPPATVNAPDTADTVGSVPSIATLSLNVAVAVVFRVCNSVVPVTTKSVNVLVPVPVILANE